MSNFFWISLVVGLVAFQGFWYYIESRNERTVKQWIDMAWNNPVDNETFLHDLMDPDVYIDGVPFKHENRTDVLQTRKHILNNIKNLQVEIYNMRSKWNWVFMEAVVMGKCNRQDIYFRGMSLMYFKKGRISACHELWHIPQNLLSCVTD